MQVISAIAVLLVCSVVQANNYFFRGKTAKMQKRAFRGRSTSEVVQEPSSSDFGTSMFSALCTELPPGENVLFSPLSVYQALALVKGGATLASRNEAELIKLLGSQTVQDQAGQVQNHSANVLPGSGVQLSMATSVWADELKQSYIDWAQQSQSAEAFPLPATYAEVDDWIQKKTNGMIAEIMGDDPLDALTKVLLVNAVYFKGIWTTEFDPSKTTDGTFFLRDRPGMKGDELEVPTRYMTAHRKMQVIHQSSTLGGASAVILDYGKHATGTDPEFSSMFLLPSSSDEASMKSLIDGLNSDPIADLLLEARDVDAKIELPRFRLEFGPHILNTTLKSMGIKTAFDDGVTDKFLQMSTDRDLYVNNVYHGACMEVTEEGTEAAAATVVVMATRSAPRVFRITFNRPFVVIILHRPTGIPVFIGKVEHPAFFF